MEIHYEILSEFYELETIRNDWSALLGRSDTNEPTLSPDWVLPWWRIFGSAEGRSLRVVLLRRGSHLVGLLLLASRRAWDHGLPLRRIELFPSGEQEQDEIASEYIGFVVERGAEADVLDVLTKALLSGALGPWDELVLPAMDGSRSFPLDLVHGFSRQGFSVTLRERTRCPFITLPATFDAYLGALSSSNRALVRRSIWDLERWAEGDLSLRVARTAAQFADARRMLVELHEGRWQASDKAGVFASAKFTAFHDSVMPAFFQQGALELTELVAGGQTIAVLYNLVWNNKVHFYQSGRRADLPNKLRPGIVAHALAIRAAIEAGRTEYDFLGGASRYKMCLAPSSRPLVDVRVARRSLRESIRGQVVRWADRMRQWNGSSPTNESNAASE